jgi:hypothetical protein
MGGDEIEGSVAQTSAKRPPTDLQNLHNANRIR